LKSVAVGRRKTLIIELALGAPFLALTESASISTAVGQKVGGNCGIISGCVYSPRFTDGDWIENSAPRASRMAGKWLLKKATPSENTDQKEV